MNASWLPIWQFCALLGLAPQDGGAGSLSIESASPLSVQVDELDGDLWCSVHAEGVPLAELLLALSLHASTRIEGLTPELGASPVTVDLRHRPLGQALYAVLGSLGLRADSGPGSWSIRPILSGARSDELEVLRELREHALASYLRAARAWPDHSEAAAAKRSQAEIEMARGNRAAAREHYEALVDLHPGSPLAPEALAALSALLERNGEWREAAERLTELVARERPVGPEGMRATELHARVALARCTARLGEWRRALIMLDALDAAAPARDGEERAERLTIRARALTHARRFDEALELLDDLATLPADDGHRAMLELRAECLEHSGELSQAARAWLGLSKVLAGKEREAALERAARLALESGEDLGALFICASAEAEDEPGELSELARAARERLGLSVSSAASPAQLAEEGQRLAAAGSYAEAWSVLRLLVEVDELRRTLDERARTEVLLACARCFEELRGVDEAVSLLRDGAGLIEAAGERRRVYLLAGEMLERAGRLEGAADAYRGRL